MFLIYLIVGKSVTEVVFECGLCSIVPLVISHSVSSVSQYGMTKSQTGEK